MTDRRVDLDLATGSNDGTSWANAYQKQVGLNSAMTASGAGDRVFVKDTSSGNGGAALALNGPTSLASAVNPVQVIAVRSDAADTVLQTNVILGHREGSSTKAYDQTGGGEDPPTLLDTNQSLRINGGIYI